MPERDGAEKSMNVIVRSDGGGVSFMVDGVGDVVEVTEDMREENPATVQGVDQELISEVYKMEDRLLLVLNTDNVLSFRAKETESTGAEG